MKGDKTGLNMLHYAGTAVLEFLCSPPTILTNKKDKISGKLMTVKIYSNQLIYINSRVFNGGDFKNDK